jgi:hypothetical protein
MLLEQTVTPSFDEEDVKKHAPVVQQSWKIALDHLGFSDLGCVLL